MGEIGCQYPNLAKLLLELVGKLIPFWLVNVQIWIESVEIFVIFKFWRNWNWQLMESSENDQILPKFGIENGQIRMKLVKIFKFW